MRQTNPSPPWLKSSLARRTPQLCPFLFSSVQLGKKPDPSNIPTCFAAVAGNVEFENRKHSSTHRQQQQQPKAMKWPALTAPVSVRRTPTKNVEVHKISNGFLCFPRNNHSEHTLTSATVHSLFVEVQHTRSRAARLCLKYVVCARPICSSWRQWSWTRSVSTCLYRFDAWTATKQVRVLCGIETSHLVVLSPRLPCNSEVYPSNGWSTWKRS